MPATTVDHWIAGRSVAGQAHRDITSPATGEVVTRVAEGGPAEVDTAVEAAAAAADGWRWFVTAERGRILHRISAAIRANADDLAALESAETGKPPATAAAEVEGAAAYFEFYAGLVNLPQGDILDVRPDQHVYTRREPFGVVGVITPWNLPINQAARAVAPALAAGNVVVAKPSESTSATTVELARLASECGLPDGVFNVVTGSGSVVGSAIVKHPGVKKVAFTGSVPVGQQIGAIAAERVIPLTLELGGKSANVVFADADLETAAKAAVKAFTTNSGQVCSSGTRLLVQRGVADDLLDRVSGIVKALEAGRDYGPLITKGQYEIVRGFLDSAAERDVPEAGAAEESYPNEDGYWIAPRIYRAGNDDPLAREEIFGPVLTVVEFDDEEEALRLANDSVYGLVGAVWTRDISRALRFAERMNAGQVAVNSWVTGAVETPFGGSGLSGYGREKGIEALNHYGQLKCVIVQL